MYRVGLGFDVHRFSKKKKELILGGVSIPFPLGLEAISDGDVVLHAISDSLCGSCSLGDIGDYFPPFPKYQGIDSKGIVKFILKKIDKKAEIVNIDIIIVAEKPILFPHKKSILNSLRKIFSSCSINLKIKSKERLNILGGKNAIACFATTLVKMKEK